MLTREKISPPPFFARQRARLLCDIAVMDAD